ncbi:hypothetical protein BLAHAN_04282 [Blautia hansenii DSM 20583]|uniref:Uncharacterized protein n=1 Tax=Blautia hansenii DSM 20583 TaxID=537007 RepID=C9L4I5_BLAHA|nr:hypothetical protein BLAHAN_04282 [Blautia hansenii DSM 20583]
MINISFRFYTSHYNTFFNFVFILFIAYFAQSTFFMVISPKNSLSFLFIYTFLLLFF